MNLFYLDHDAKLSAKYHCDKHVVKMILEYAQLLSTAHRLLDGRETTIKQNNRNMRRWVLDNTNLNESLYKATHFNHPCSVWVRKSNSNYQYLYKLFCYLCDEYTLRYNKVHMTEQKLRKILEYTPNNIPSLGFSTPPCCMPDNCVIFGDVVSSYQKYYKLEKSYMAVWSKRTTPNFMD